MASICNDPGGRKRLVFFGADGRRRTIRLGKLSLRHAESVKVKVEDLVASAIHKHAPRDDTSRWLASLDDVLHKKLAKVGLCKARDTSTLEVFINTYIERRQDIKPGTRRNLEITRDHLLGYFTTPRSMRDITPADAEAFRLHLATQGMAENTARRTIGRARQFFKSAMKGGLIVSNPFEGLAANVRANPKRYHFVSREDARKVLDHCPDVQWQLIFALARFGGLRCPSEVLALTWEDINWEHNRIHVTSPKTEHHPGGESRMIPLFPELRPILMEAFEQAEPGDVHVVTRYLDSRTNLRTQLHRIIKRAGLAPWPKLYQNLRSTRETELAEAYPIHVVCKWLGNSEAVAAAHYLQLTDAHFDRAAGLESRAAHNAAQKMSETTGNDQKSSRRELVGCSKSSEDFRGIPVIADCFTGGLMTVRGFEPLTCCSGGSRSIQLSYTAHVDTNSTRISAGGKALVD